MLPQWVSPRWVPLIYPEHDWTIFLPLWIPFLLIGIVVVWFWWSDARSFVAGGCEACGYDLTGNSSGVCPECGTSVGEQRVSERNEDNS